MDKSSRSENSQVRTNILLEREETISIKKTTKYYVERKQTRVRQLYDNNNNNNNNQSRNTTRESAAAAAANRNHHNRRRSFDNKQTNNKRTTTTTTTTETKTTTSRSKSLQSTNFQLQALNQRIEHEIDKLKKYRMHLLSNQKAKKSKQKKEKKQVSQEAMTWRENFAANKSNIEFNYKDQTRISNSSCTTRSDNVAIKPRICTIGLQEVQDTRNAVSFNSVRVEQNTERSNARTISGRSNARASGGCTFGHSNEMQYTVYQSDYARNAAVNCCNYQQCFCPYCNGYIQQPAASAQQYCVPPAVCMSGHRCYCPPVPRQSTDLNTEDFCRNRAHELQTKRSRSSSAKRRATTRPTVDRGTNSKSKSPKRNQKSKQLPEGLSDISSLHKYHVKEKQKLVKVTLERSSQASIDIRESASSVMRVTEYKPAPPPDKDRQAEAAKRITEEEKQKLYNDYSEQYKSENKANMEDAKSVELRGDKTYSKMPYPETTQDLPPNADNQPDVNEEELIVLLDRSKPDANGRVHQTHSDGSGWATQGAEDQVHATDSYKDQTQTDVQQQQRQPEGATKEQQQESYNQQQNPESQPEHPTSPQQNDIINQQQQPTSPQQQESFNQQQQPTSPQQQESFNQQQQPTSLQQQESFNQQQQPTSPQQQDSLNQQQQQLQQQQQHPIGQQRQQAALNEREQLLNYQQRYALNQQQQQPFNQREQVSSVTYIKQLTTIKRVERPTQTDTSLTCCRTDLPREIYGEREEAYSNMQCPCRRRQFDEFEEPRFNTQPSYEKRPPYSRSLRREEQYDNRCYADQVSRNYEQQATNGYEGQRESLKFIEEESLASNRSPVYENRRAVMQPADTRREDTAVSQILPEPSNYVQRSPAQRMPAPNQSRQAQQPEYNSGVNQPRGELPTSPTQAQPAYRQVANNGTTMPAAARSPNYQNFESPPVRLVNLPEHKCCSVTSVCSSYEQVVCTTTRRAVPCERQPMLGNEDQIHRNNIDRQRQETPTGNAKLPPQAGIQEWDDLNRSQAFGDAPIATSTEYAPNNWMSKRQEQANDQRGHNITSESIQFQPEPAELRQRQMMPSKSMSVFQNNTDALRSAQYENVQPTAESLAAAVTMPMTDQETDYVPTYTPENNQARTRPPLSPTRTIETQSQTERRRSVDFYLPPIRSLPNHATASAAQYANHQRQRGNQQRCQRRQPMESDYRRYRSTMPVQRMHYDTDELTSYSSSTPSAPAYRQSLRNRPMPRHRHAEMSPNRRTTHDYGRECEIVESRETIMLRRSPIDWQRCRRNPPMLMRGEAYAQPATDYSTADDDALLAGENFGSCTTLQTCMDSDYGDYLTCDESQGDDNNACQQLPQFKGCACMYDTYLNMAAMCMPRQQQQALSPRNAQNHEARYTQQQQQQQQQRSFY